jgi:hypothetical protein
MAERRWLRCSMLIACLATMHAQAELADRSAADAATAKSVDAEVTLPAAPQSASLIEFYVSAAATNHFFIDGATLAVTDDGVVRYVLVVKTAGGATNVTFEGMRCNTGEYRIFASGHADGTWTKSRSETWRPIENKMVNRHHAALSREFFCVDGIPFATAEQGRDILRRGGNQRSTN